jgi:hypothetical protein
MASSINALTTGSGGVITTADNSGDLNIQSGGSTKIAVTSAGVAVTGLSKGSLPTGSVLQVVNATYNTDTSMSYSASYATTGLSLAITPTSATSKIYVFANQNIYNLGAGSNYANVGLQVRRDGSAIYTPSGSDGSGLYSFGYAQTTPALNLRTTLPIQYLDSPATTSSVTYAIYARLGISGNACAFNFGGSSITLMEIAA